jgi:hypothetical protein
MRRRRSIRQNPIELFMIADVTGVVTAAKTDQEEAKLSRRKLYPLDLVMPLFFTFRVVLLQDEKRRKRTSSIEEAKLSRRKYPLDLVVLLFFSSRVVLRCRLRQEESNL